MMKAATLGLVIAAAFAPGLAPSFHYLETREP